ncbi:MAG: hypothetical protein OXC40_05170, partial [Proteobacteria bacterium]|nr:hypothetical protein [Pseudomonadota bacterium]
MEWHHRSQPFDSLSHIEYSYHLIHSLLRHIFCEPLRFISYIFFILLLVVGLYSQTAFAQENILGQDSSRVTQSYAMGNSSLYASTLGAAVFMEQSYLGRLQQPRRHFLKNIYRKLPARVQKLLLPAFMLASGVTYAVWQTLSSDLVLGDSLSDSYPFLNNLGVLNMELEGEEDLVFAGEETIDDLMDEDLMPELDPRDPNPVIMGSLLKKESKELVKNDWDIPLDPVTERQITREQDQDSKEYVLNTIKGFSDAPAFFQVSDHKILISRFVNMTNQSIQEALSRIKIDTSTPLLDQDHIQLWGKKLAYTYLNNQLMSAVEIYVFFADILGLNDQSLDDIAKSFNMKPEELMFIRSQILKDINGFTSRPIHKLFLSASRSNLDEIKQTFLSLSTRELKHLLEPIIQEHINFTYAEWLLLKPSYIIDFLDSQKTRSKEYVIFFFKRLGGEKDHRRNQSFIDLLGKLRLYLFEQNIFFSHVLNEFRSVAIPSLSEATYDKLISSLYDMDADVIQQRLGEVFKDIPLKKVDLAQFSMVLQMYPKIKALYLSQVLGLGHMSMYQFSDTFDMESLKVMTISNEIRTVFLKFIHAKEIADNTVATEVTGSVSQNRQTSWQGIKSLHQLSSGFYEMTPEAVLRRLIAKVLPDYQHLLTVESYISRKDYHELINLMKASSLSKRIFLSHFVGLDYATPYQIAIIHKLPKETVLTTYDTMAQQITEYLLSRISRHSATDHSLEISNNNEAPTEGSETTGNGLMNHNSQNRHISWLSSTPAEINALYVRYSPDEMVAFIKQSRKLKDFFAVGLPYLSPEKYLEFEEKMLMTPFERHLFISYLLG